MLNTVYQKVHPAMNDEPYYGDDDEAWYNFKDGYDNDKPANNGHLIEYEGMHGM